MSDDDGWADREPPEDDWGPEPEPVALDELSDAAAEELLEDGPEETVAPVGPAATPPGDGEDDDVDGAALAVETRQAAERERVAAEGGPRGTAASAGTRPAGQVPGDDDEIDPWEALDGPYERPGDAVGDPEEEDVQPGEVDGDDLADATSVGPEVPTGLAATPPPSAPVDDPGARWPDPEPGEDDDTDDEWKPVEGPKGAPLDVFAADEPALGGQGDPGSHTPAPAPEREPEPPAPASDRAPERPTPQSARGGSARRRAFEKAKALAAQQQPVAQAVPGVPEPEDAMVSEDDEVIGDLAAVGQPVIAAVLGGVVIDEKYE